MEYRNRLINQRYEFSYFKTIGYGVVNDDNRSDFDDVLLIEGDRLTFA